MDARHWPLFDLRVTTPTLELRYPDDELAVALVDLAAAGVHDPATMPFSIPWTDTPPGELQTQSLQYFWRGRAGVSPAGWDVPMAVLVDGEVVGVQGMTATEFGRRRTLLTGSWLGRSRQGRGIGTEMRQAILHLAFAGLGAEQAETGAWHDNEASLAVTRRLGYEPNGEVVELRRDVADRQLKFRMTRASWETRLRRDDIHLHGVAPCLPLLVGS